MAQRSYVTLILDWTGSMQDIREDVAGGFNAFLAQQQAGPDPVDITSVLALTLSQYVPRESVRSMRHGRGVLYLETTLEGHPTLDVRLGERLRH